MTMVFGLAVLQLGLLLATSKVFGCPGCPHQFLKRHDSPLCYHGFIMSALIHALPEEAFLMQQGIVTDTISL